jgi:predicted Zn-dependent protease
LAQPPKTPPQTAASTTTPSASSSSSSASPSPAQPAGRPVAKVPLANRPPLASQIQKPSAPTPAAPAPTSTATQLTPGAASAKKEGALFKKLQQIARHEITWAEAMDLTRSEAFGIAQNAYRLFEFGQHERGRKIVEGLVVLNPKVGAFHALLGAMAGRMGDEAAAEASYTAAIGVEPDNLAARVNRAEMRLKAGNLGDALDDLLAATKIDPKGKTPLGKRAQSLARVTSQALRELLKKAPARTAATPSSAAKTAPRR